MNSITKTFLCVFIVLFFISIYKDLTVGTSLTSNNKQHNEEYVTYTRNITTIRVKVNQGDTLLTIVEKLNQQTSDRLNVKQIVSDFKLLNPTEDPMRLISGEYYSFPIYEKEADD